MLDVTFFSKLVLKSGAHVSRWYALDNAPRKTFHVVFAIFFAY